ncbi:MAG: SLC13 family permease [Acidobacteria bacterium]|nr:SLC13 family permease [Acidobacteriota bacterium]MCW5968728.1 SLC13 family permease [Blastocatellales bacterium]
MTFDMIVVLGLVVISVVLFATERFPVDLVALMVLGTLMLTGMVTIQEGLSGLSNEATVTVAAMIVLSAGLAKTGAVSFIGVGLNRIGKRSFWLALAMIMVVVGAVSAFINNTAAVAIFMPIVLGLARELKASPSKLLMPLSFASMFGGVCTLIGTSTNILVNSIAVRNNQPAFGMFEFAPLGLIFFGAGALYLMLVGVRLIPARRGAEDLTESFGMGEYLTEIKLLREAASVGKKLSESPLVRELDIEVLEILRGDDRVILPGPETVLRAFDVLRVRADVAKINRLAERAGVELVGRTKWDDGALQSSEAALVEAIIAPGSPLVGQSLKSIRFRQRYDAVVLAIRQGGELRRANLDRVLLRAGDVLLLEARLEAVARLKERDDFVLVSEVGLPTYRRRQMIPALMIVAGVVACSALNIVPIVVGSLVGCVLMVLTRCLTLEESYQAVEWRVVFLLAGVLPLGIALEKTGAALFLSNSIVNTVGVWGPVAVLSAFYLLTSLLTETMSNNATAVLLAPIAIASAQSLGCSPRPFLLAVTFAASASFMTPVGYQTNTLIYGPGRYRFADFLRVGTPLNILYWLIASWLIPVFWPF